MRRGHRISGYKPTLKGGEVIDYSLSPRTIDYLDNKRAKEKRKGMEIKNTMAKACPHLIFTDIVLCFNKLVVTPEGWRFFEHTDPDGNVTNVQFCKKIGRKRDVFECINESEWRVCPHNRLGVNEG